MVTFYFDDAIAKVWYDDSIPCLFTKVHRTLTSSDLALLSKTVSGAVKKLKQKQHEPVFSVTDLRSCENWSADLVTELVIHVIGAEYKAGISRKFVIRPIDKSSRNALVKGLVAVPNMNTSVYDHASEVVREIERFKLLNKTELIPENSLTQPFKRFMQRISDLRS